MHSHLRLFFVFSGLEPTGALVQSASGPTAPPRRPAKEARSITTFKLSSANETLYINMNIIAKDQTMASHLSTATACNFARLQGKNE